MHNIMRKILGTICGILLLAGPMMAFAQNDSTPMPTGAITTTTATPTSLVNITANLVNVTAANATVPQPPSLGGLLIIFGAMVLIVLIPIWIFAWYNKNTLEKVLDANKNLPADTKREPVSTLIKALISPEPLGMPNGSVRAVIAIIGISIFAYAVFNFPDNTKELLSAMIAIVSSVTGFYFGARATEEVRTPPESPKPEQSPKPPEH